jgi:predicted dienelactone hydrolase
MANVNKAPLARRVLKGLLVLVTVGVIGFATLLSVLWLERRGDVTLPEPTGPFAVGRAMFAWGNGSTDILAPVPGTKREVSVWVWYPAVGRPTLTEDYLPLSWRTAVEGTRGWLIRILTRDLSKVHAHSLRNSDVSPQQASYPVVIFRAGASAQVTNYTTLVEDLASHGYIVVGIDAPYRTSVVVFPDGRVVERTPENNPELVSGPDLVRRANKLLAAWTSDMSFVLDQLERLNASDASGRFTGRLDMKRVGVFGHSFGGAQAAQFCHEDSRCEAGIDIDGAPFGSVIQTGLHQPFMFLFSSQGDFSTNTEISKIQADVQSIYDRLPANGRLRVVIRGANHFTFSDDGALLKSRIMRAALHVFGKLDIDGPRQLAVTAYCVHSFFDAYLGQPPISHLQISSPRYPEIRVLD